MSESHDEEPAFTSHEEGTTAADWQHTIAALPRAGHWAHHGRPSAAAAHRPDGEPHAPVTRLVVVAAHPDDETLGAGGRMSGALVAGAPVTLVMLTRGDASHPHSPTHDPARLAKVRSAELHRAMARLAERPDSEGARDIRVVEVGLPDGQLAEHGERAVAAIVDAIGTEGRGTLVLAPWRHDRHPDHEAAGHFAAIAARRTQARLVEYPIWFWHWGRPGVDGLPAGAVRMDLAEGSVRAKAAAMAEHHSQTEPLSDQPGDERLLLPGFLEHFERGHEVYFPVPSAELDSDDALDALHAEHEDPWHVLGSPYELRKRAITLAMLPPRRFGRVLELGCSIGALMRDLAERAAEVIGVDSSAAALERARVVLDGVDNVTLRQATLPAPLERDCDLVVLSELGYFLDPAALDALVEEAVRALRPGGLLLLCHWRGPVVGWPLDGDAVHERVAAVLAGIAPEVQEPQLQRGHLLTPPSDSALEIPGARMPLLAQYVEDDFRVALHGPADALPAAGATC